jgi:hypothetical protein
MSRGGGDEEGWGRPKVAVGVAAEADVAGGFDDRTGKRAEEDG